MENTQKTLKKNKKAKKVLLIVLLSIVCYTLAMLTFVAAFETIVATVFNDVNKSAINLVKKSEIIDELGEMKLVNVDTIFYKKTDTGGATTQLILVTSDEKTRYQIKVRIEKDENDEWYLYSWKILDERPYDK